MKEQNGGTKMNLARERQFRPEEGKQTRGACLELGYDPDDSSHGD